MALQLAMKQVQPVFKVTWSEYRVCPICGKTFKAKINTWRADPTHAHYCSKRCRMRANDRTLAGLVTDKEFEEQMFYSWETIHAAIMNQISLSVHDKSLGYKDVMQECLITLWLMMCRERRAGRETRLNNNGYLFNILRKSMKHSKAWIKRNMHDEEAVLDEFKQDGLGTLVPDNYDIDKVLDIRQILNEVYELAKKNRNVAMAVEKAVNYRIHQDKLMGAKLRAKHGVTTQQYFDNIKKGVEYIFYMMPDQIQHYINIADTNETFRFHPNYNWKKLKGRDISKFTADELSRYFSDERQCCICGKFFVPTAVQRGKDRVVCSPLCKRKLDNLRCKEARERKKQRLLELERQSECK